jgi:Ca-activated chloride channel family protein
MKLPGVAAIALLVWSGGQAPTFRVAVDAVRADVLVTDGNRPVAGLTSADFELRDSGVLQQIESVAFEDVPLSVMLALDTSGSVAGGPLVHLKEAATAVVRLLKPADRGALMTFAGALRLHCSWTGNRDALEKAIAAAEAGGWTPLYDAAYAALTLRDPTPGRTLVLIFSDGADTGSWLPGAQVIEIARRNEAVVYGVTMGSEDVRVPGYRLDFHSGMQLPIKAASTADRMEPFLEALSDETGGRVLNALRSDRLRDTFVRIVTEFRSRYLLTYSPRGVDAGGWHPLEVRVKGRRVKVTARRGYLR